MQVYSIYQGSLYEKWVQAFLFIPAWFLPRIGSTASRSVPVNGNEILPAYSLPFENPSLFTRSRSLIFLQNQNTTI